MEEIKRCSTCKDWMPLDMFHLTRNNPDGHTHICKYCRSNNVRIEWCDRLEREIKNGDGLTVADTLPYKPQERDMTLPRVYKSLWYWMRYKVLTRAQAEAIIMRDVDRLSWADIARLCETDKTTVRYHYNRGMANLRKTYGIEVIASDAG